MTAKFTIDATYGNFTARCEGETQKEVFEALAQATEILQFSTCGKCGGKTRHVVRTTKSDDTYYSVNCKECRYEMKFGQYKNDKHLFAKSSDGWQPPYQASPSQSSTETF